MDGSKKSSTLLSLTTSKLQKIRSEISQVVRNTHSKLEKLIREFVTNVSTQIWIYRKIWISRIKKSKYTKHERGFDSESAVGICNVTRQPAQLPAAFGGCLPSFEKQPGRIKSNYNNHPDIFFRWWKKPQGRIT